MVAYRQTNRRRSLLILLVVTAITLMTLDARTSGGGALRELARNAVSPLQGGVSSVTTPVSDWFSGIIGAGSLRNENRELRRDLEAARGAAERGETAERENEQLKRLLEIEAVGQIPAVAARVVGGSVGSFDWSVQIDRGTGDGVAVGMPVVAGEGLVGRVVATTPNRSTVLLLTDPTSGVGVRIQRTGVTGIAEGRTGRDTLKLAFVDATADVVDGDLIVTSGLQNGRFPPGITVGRVEDFTRRPGALDLDAQIRPAVDMRTLEFVKVLRYEAPPQ